MRIQQLMYLDKFLEAPEVICVFPVNKKITLQDIRKDVIEKIEENFKISPPEIDYEVSIRWKDK